MNDGFGINLDIPIDCG
jgi:hypothetical protein